MDETEIVLYQETNDDSTLQDVLESITANMKSRDQAMVLYHLSSRTLNQ